MTGAFQTSGHLQVSLIRGFTRNREQRRNGNGGRVISSLLGIPEASMVVAEDTKSSYDTESPEIVNIKLLAQGGLPTDEKSLSIPMKSHQTSLIPLPHVTTLRIFGHSSQVSPGSTFPRINIQGLLTSLTGLTYALSLSTSSCDPHT